MLNLHVNSVVNVGNMKVNGHAEIESVSFNSVSMETCSCTNFSCVNASVTNLSVNTGSFTNIWIDPCVILSSSILDSMIQNCCITDACKHY